MSHRCLPLQSQSAITRFTLIAFLIGAEAFVSGCGKSHDDSASEESRSGGASGSDFASGGTTELVGGAGAGAGSSVDLGGLGDDGSGLGRAGFRFGINLGHPNPDFGDDEMADLAAQVGVTSIRLKYPEYHFDNWGQDIEVGDAKHYASLNMKDHVAFVIGMTEAHSTAPAGSADWERDYYIPKNLYEPILDDEGEVNANNYYATYLAATFSTYKEWVKYWEIFNEPDWVADWQVTQSWDTEAPGAANELVRFHGTIYDYVRMLRIATVVRDKVAPGTLILTGGLGYPSFLNALLRSTDNPDGGKVTDAYPKKGGEWFDVLSIHHYPHLIERGSSDKGLASLVGARDAFFAELEAADQADKGWMITENGAAHTKTEGAASGPEYARNYLQKSFIWAKAEGFLGVDWFPLSDGNEVANPFEQMGLYANLSSLSSTSEALETTSGEAYLTTSHVLSAARLDLGKTAALSLPPGAQGYVFASGAQEITALWAVSDEDEDVAVEVTLPFPEDVTRITWDDGAAAPGETLSPTAGLLTLELDASPVFLSSQVK